MKKFIKIMSLCVCFFAMAFAFCACTEPEKKVQVSRILLSTNEITLYVGEQSSSEEEFVVSFKPANATQIDIELFSYDDNLIDVERKQNTGDTFIVRAHSIQSAQAHTFIGVRMKGNVDVQANCRVNVIKTSQKLRTITGLNYNQNFNRIEWDASQNTEQEGFNGYKLMVNDKEYIVTNNNMVTQGNKNIVYFENFTKGEVVSCKVQAISKVHEYDSDESEELKFKVIDSVQNFKHNNGQLSWDNVAGANEYVLKVNYEPDVKLPSQTTTYTYNFEISNTYRFQITAKGQDETLPDGTVIKCYDSKPTAISVTKFSAPLNFNYKNPNFNWNTVVTTSGAVPLCYEVYEQLPDGQEVKVATTNDISYTLPANISVGEHSYKVKTIGDGVNTISSDFTAIKTITKLDTPKNLRVENGVITWDRQEDAQTYKLSYSGYYEGQEDDTTFHDLTIMQPMADATKVNFVFGDRFKGGYSIKVASVSDQNNTADSAYTDEIYVTKLECPMQTTFGLVNNTLTWQAIQNASAYQIYINYGEETVMDFVYANSENPSLVEYQITQQLEVGEVSYYIKSIGNTASGDSAKYLTSENSPLSYVVKLANPELSLDEGILRWTNVYNSKGTMLEINDREIDMQKICEYDFSQNTDANGNPYLAGNYYVRVKALGGNVVNTSSKYIVGCVDSEYSNILGLTKYQTPIMNVENGEIKYNSPDGAPTIETTKTRNEDGSYTFVCVAKGDSSSHISSDMSEPLIALYAPDIENLSMTNGVLSWNAIDSKYDGAKFKVRITGTLDNGDNFEENLDSSLNNSCDFSSEVEYPSGEYNVQITVAGTSGTNRPILNNGRSAIYSFARLPIPEVKADGVFDALMNGTLDIMPGDIYWNAVDIAGQSPVGYNIKVLKNGNVLNNYDVKNQRTFHISGEAGEYKVSVQANGNGSKILSSGYGEELTFNKLKSVSNIELDEYGTVSWSCTDYNQANSGVIGMFTNLPLNLRVAFVLEVDGVYYNIYDLAGLDLSNMLGNENAQILSDLNAQREVNLNDLRTFSGIDGDKINLSNGTHKFRIWTTPLNKKIETGISLYPVWGVDNDLLAEPSEYITFTKLEQPYGLKADRREDDGHYIINFTESLSSSVTGYELAIRDINNPEQEEIIISLEGRTNVRYDFTQQYLLENNISSGNFAVKIRAISTTAGIISSNYTEELTLNLLNNIELSIADGQLKWSRIENAEQLVFTFTNIDNPSNPIVKTFVDETSYALTLENDENFVAGNYNIKVKVIGNETSNYGNVIYLDTFNAKDFGEFTKLRTVQSLEVENGMLMFGDINYDNIYSDGNYNYNLIVITSNTNTENLGKTGDRIDSLNNVIYELPNKYSAGNYSFKVQAMGNEHFLNAEISNVIDPETVVKLNTTRIFISNGILNWTSVENNSGYQVKISGGDFKVKEGDELIDTNENASYLVDVLNGMTALNIGQELVATDGTSFLLGAGEYSVQVKVLGTSITYLNSNFSTARSFKKLAQVQGVKIKDGELTWQKLTNSQAPNGITLNIKFSNKEEYEQPIIITDNNINSFSFGGEKYPADYTYDIFLQTIGDTNLNPDDFRMGYITGTVSDTLTQKVKLPRVDNAHIDADSKSNDIIGTYTFDKIERVYSTMLDGVNNDQLIYEIHLIVTQGEDVNEITQEITIEEDDTYKFEINSGYAKSGSFEASTKIEIQVRALGKDDYFDGEYTDMLTVIIPSTPEINPIVDGAGRFTGKIEWSEILVGDYTTKYILQYQYISREYADLHNINTIEDIQEQTWNDAYEVANPSEEDYTNCFYEKPTDNKYEHIYGRGYYRFRILAMVEINQNTIRSMVNDWTDPYNYSLFDAGDGSVEHPFVVNTALQFNYIRYNLTAHYKLGANIDFSTLNNNSIEFDRKLYDIGSKKEPFTGSFTGKNTVFDASTQTNIDVIYALSNITITDVAENSSLFDVVGQGGKVSNVIVNNIRITNGSNVGGIVGYNEGTIENIIVGAVLNNEISQYEYDGSSSISPYSNKAVVCYVGGIVGYNKAIVRNCINYSIVAPMNENEEVRCGGIAGYNEGTIEDCINYNTIGGLITKDENNNNVYEIYSNMSGGIVGWNENVSTEQPGYVNYCANYASVLATSRNQAKISQGAYVGGIVAYNQNGKVEYCFNDNSNGRLNGYASNENLEATSVLYATTSLVDMGIYIGGIVGKNEDGSTLLNCASICNIHYEVNTQGNIVSTLAVGTIIGQNKVSINAVARLADLYSFALDESQVDKITDGLIGGMVADKTYAKRESNDLISDFVDYNKVKNILNRIQLILI